MLVDQRMRVSVCRHRSRVLMLVVTAVLLVPLLPASASGGNPGELRAEVLSPGPQALGPCWADSSGLPAPSTAIPLDDFIQTQMARAHMPGLSAAMVKHGQVVWTGAYGYARVNAQRPVTEDTLFELASISKTFIATAVMQLWEKGQLDLDADINLYLPFHVVNPHFPDSPITTRMLVAHTSSITDSGAILVSSYVLGDPTILLGQFLKDFLSPEGAYYDPDRNYANAEPGKVWDYSNWGASLAAYLVEVISGIPFDAYCDAYIFEPLGMTETSYRFSDLDLSHIAMPSGYNVRTGNYLPYGFLGSPLYPAGWVITSAPQLARHLIAFMQFGEIDGVRILQPETVEEMRRIQYPEIGAQPFGVFWYYKSLRDRVLLGHNGGNYGVATEMFFDAQGDVGVILLMNGDWTSRPSNVPMVYSIEDRLFREAESY
jgi:CubicO group peptidase (beta-lactamase class C family)